MKSKRASLPHSHLSHLGRAKEYFCHPAIYLTQEEQRSISATQPSTSPKRSKGVSLPHSDLDHLSRPKECLAGRQYPKSPGSVFFLLFFFFSFFLLLPVDTLCVLSHRHGDCIRERKGRGKGQWRMEGGGSERERALTELPAWLVIKR